MADNTDRGSGPGGGTGTDKSSSRTPGRPPKDPNQGRLRIGNQWNAIRIIALSQNNPLKAIAEFVENSIDAEARNISIVRGKAKGEQYLKVIDDGTGISDFRYVATHIGDSIKRRLKEQGQENIQGEFGIGLLSFWTVGNELVLTSCPPEGEAQRLHLMKDSPDFAIRPSRELFERAGTTLHIQPLLSGVRNLSGEKIQSYLASELRDRISRSGVSIRIVDRTARKDLLVEPRRFHGRLLHGLPEARTPLGEIYTELYLAEPGSGAGVALHKQGTRVLPDITRSEAFRRPPWTSGYVEGIVDCSFLQLTPGTRDGVVYDANFDSFVDAIAPIEEALLESIEEYRRAEDEEASKAMLKRITKALKEAFSMLPADEYGWLNAGERGRAGNRRGKQAGRDGAGDAGDGGGGDGTGPGTGSPLEAGDASAAEGEAAAAAQFDPNAIPSADDPGVYRDETVAPGTAIEDPSSSRDRDGGQRAFFEYPGPLYRLEIRPAKTRVTVNGECRLQATPRDKSRRAVDSDVEITWVIEHGSGHLDVESGEYVTYHAPEEPELAVVGAHARQDQVECEARATITVTAELGGAGAGSAGTGAVGRQGMPGYTYRYAPGELWRSRYQPEQSLVIVNSGHADFVYAARQSASKLRYVGRLFAKEIVLANFPGAPRDELLERMIELELYMDRALR
ncbi:MAG: ATP-binding protein [Alkalispirochaeta sp.]